MGKNVNRKMNEFYASITFYNMWANQHFIKKKVNGLQKLKIFHSMIWKEKVFNLIMLQFMRQLCIPKNSKMF